jgi:nucleoside 2-deoxyribosyltransferase
MKLYLAGPDVFFNDTAAHYASKRKLCQNLGFTALTPLDSDPQNWQHLPVAEQARSIYQANITLMQQADVILANLTPWQGVSADVGTVFELGFMRAQGKPCFAYSNDGRDLSARMATLPDLQMNLEAFGLTDNLMLDMAITQSGGVFLRGTLLPDAADYYSSLETFGKTLEALARYRHSRSTTQFGSFAAA